MILDKNIGYGGTHAEHIRGLSIFTRVSPIKRHGARINLIWMVDNFNPMVDKTIVCYNKMGGGFDV